MAMIRWRPFGHGVERWDPARDMGDLQQEMNRLMESFFGRAPQVALERAWAPVMDIYETKDDLVVSTELPGVTEKDIQVSITGDVLTLRGERLPVADSASQSQYRSERWYGKFERAVQLPIAVQADKVKATFRDGVLTVRLPKVEEIKPKEIKIDVL